MKPIEQLPSLKGKEYLRYVHLKCGAEITSGNTNLKDNRICPKCKGQITFKPTSNKGEVILYTKEMM